jgi:hypothetical protein
MVRSQLQGPWAPPAAEAMFPVNMAPQPYGRKRQYSALQEGAERRDDMSHVPPHGPPHGPPYANSGPPPPYGMPPPYMGPNYSTVGWGPHPMQPPYAQAANPQPPPPPPPPPNGPQLFSQAEVQEPQPKKSRGGTARSRT